MKERLQKRLQSLKAEYEAGEKMLADLETKQQNLQQTLLRISGAIQVIEEELADSEENGNPPSAPERTVEVSPPVEVSATSE
ncbi:MAG: hypothetical protein EBE86_028840 [Hormoscilla sp. GUM202]|nr:hypothetical protein [Hormoscilla sp. GUM202]